MWVCKIHVLYYVDNSSVTVIFRVMLKMIWMKRRCWPVMMRMRKMRRVGRGGGDTEEEEEEELPESPNIRHLYHYFLSYLHCIINEKKLLLFSIQISSQLWNDLIQKQVLHFIIYVVLLNSLSCMLR